MSYKLHKKLEDHEGDSSGYAWLVSFGDLLTLLLCFFLAIVSMSPLNPHVSSNKKTDSSATYAKNIRPPEVIAENMNDGITLALSLAEEVNGAPITEFQEHWLKETDFVDQGMHLMPEKLKMIKKLVVESNYLLRNVEIETCEKPPLTKIREHGSPGLERGLNIRRQVLDVASVSDPSAIRVSVVRGECSELSSESNGKLSAVVRVFRDIQHG